MTRRSNSRFLVAVWIAAACTELSVAAVDVMRVDVSPGDVLLRVGESTMLVAEAQDRDGNSLVDRPIAWSSSDEGVVTVDPTGRVAAVAAGSALVIASAGDRQGTAAVTVSSANVRSVEILPRTPAVLVGGTIQLDVEVRDERGLPLDVPVQWTSSNEAVLTVSDGLVTAIALGSARVRASAGGATDSVTVILVPRPGGSVSVSPASAVVLEGETIRFTATVFGSDGSAQPGAAVEWRTGDASIVQVDAGGLATAVGRGETTITAVSGNHSGSATVRVSSIPVASVTVTPAVAGVPIGGTLQLTATARDAGGAVLSGRVVEWASANSQIAAVDASGRVTGLAGGATEISATVDGVSGSSFVAVTQVQVAAVQVSPASGQLAPGGTLWLTATARDAAGNPLSGRTAIWSSSNAAVATVDVSGLVTARTDGTVTIMATIAGVAGSATITVVTPPQPVATVTVAPASASLQVGNTTQLTATTRAADGTVLTGRVVTWLSSDPAVATVNGTGLVTAAGAGSATISASSEGRSGSATITVTMPPQPVATVTVAPASASLQVGNTTQLTATTRAADGTVLTGRVVTWSSSDPAVTTVGGTGLVTAAGTGNATISATSEGTTGTASITVTSPVLTPDRIEVVPSLTTVRVGTQVQLTATVRAADGTALPGYSIDWSSSDSSIANVTGQGQVNAKKPGTVTITAAAAGLTGTAIVVILP